MLRKFLVLTLAVLMIISFVSCDTSKPTDSSETTKKDHPVADVTPPKPYEPDEEPDLDDSTANYWVDLVVAGKAQYTVVSEAEEYDGIAATFGTRLTANTGAHFVVKTAAEKNSVTGKKISVGKKPSLVMTDPLQLTYRGSLSLHSGKTIYLTGHGMDGVQGAINKFLEGARPQYQVRNERGQIDFKAPDIRLFFLYNPDSYINTSPTVLGVALSDFVIVVPEKINAAEHFALKYLMDNIGTRTGCVMTQTDDRSEKAANEIVLGKTARPESQALYGALEDGQFAIKSVGGSIYVAYDNYLVMEDAYNTIYETVTGNSNEKINILEAPDYASQMVKKENDYFVRIMTSNIVCAGDSGAVEDYDINGVNCTLRVGIQGTMIMDYLPDFVGMQEMQEGTVNGIYSLMRTDLLATVGSEYSFVNYPELSAAEYWDPILYRHTVWQIEAQDVMAPETFDNGMHRWQWALFSKIENPYQKCIVMNLHYPTGRFPDMQIAAAATVNEEIKHLQEIYPNVPVFLTGDFNARPGTDAFDSTFEGTGLVTANADGRAIDHVVYDSTKVAKMCAKSIDNGYIAKSSDHRPFFADVMF